MGNPNLASFLTFGYFLDYEHPSIKINFANIDKAKYKNADEAELVKRGSDLWREAIANSFDSSVDNVVPLSGGLDSRAILAGLIEHMDAGRIHTYTFGTPGTWDYEIGCCVARTLGTKHQEFDLRSHVYKQEELEDISQRMDQQALLFHHGPIWIIDQQYGGYVYWSGFMGDPIAGSHLLRRPSKSLDSAKRAFVLRNRYVKSIELASYESNFLPLIDQASSSEERHHCLTLDEQLDFANRQLKYVAPTVMMRGYRYKVPFLYQPWVDFMIGVDNIHRYRQRLYKLILLNAFRNAFGLKTKTNWGLPLRATWHQVLPSRIAERIRRTLGKPCLSTNYLDFNRQIRTKPDLRDIISRNISELSNRNLLGAIDCNGILQDHLRGRGRHADVLLVLCSLEIHLKTGKVV